MGNYFDNERELGLASKEFNRKTAVYNLKYESLVEEFLDATMFEACDLKETAAWYMLRHTDLVEKLLEFDYQSAINDRILKFKEPFTITESIVFGKDEDRLARMRALSDMNTKVEAIREAVESGTIKDTLLGIKELIPVYCLFENDAVDMVREKLEDAKEEVEEKREELEKAQEKEQEEDKKDEEEKSEEDSDNNDEEESDGKELERADDQEEELEKEDSEDEE